MKKLISWLSYLFVIVSAIGMTAIPSGCSNEESFFKENSPAGFVTNDNNRTLQEARSLAAEAYRTFIDSNYVESRSGSIIDYTKPVIVLGSPLSRSNEANDTLIYIVNYADEAGYAIIAAPKKVEPVLAVVQEGSYNEDLDDPEAHSPGFLMWLDNARAYIAGIGGIRDTLPDDGDMHAEPIFGKTQVKEYNETISCVDIQPLVRNSWKQSAPQGSDCDNKVCGCSPLALAEIGLAFHRPATVTDPKTGENITLNWAEIGKHQYWATYNRNMWKDNSWNVCGESDIATTHKQIAVLCHYIGVKCDADYNESGQTGVHKNNTLKVAKQIFGTANVSSDWKEYKNDALPTNQSILLFRGEGNTDNGKTIRHQWICDGVYSCSYYHVISTRTEPWLNWTTTRTGPVNLIKLHFNWGWNGQDNGWFWEMPIQTKNGNFDVFEYLIISNN